MKLFTTSIHYADFLAVTLPEWKTRGDVTVITRADDYNTVNLCRQVDMNCLVTDRWMENGSTINKGAAQQAAVELFATPGEPIVLFDADCYPIGDPMELLLPLPDELVGCCRYDCRTAIDFYQRLRNPAHPLPEINGSTYRPELLRGYFHFFIYQEHLRFGRTRDTTFSGCDLYLASQFSVNTRVAPDKFHVLHLGVPRVNWKGRVSGPWT